MPDLFGHEGLEVVRRAAEISECGRYRYSLTRSWQEARFHRTVCFVMLNPSTADGETDDPTIRRCMGFARSWGFSTLVVRNLYCYRATKPADLLTVRDPVGPLGDIYLESASEADLLIAAWGTLAPHSRVQNAYGLWGIKPIRCLGLTKEGRPRHPLYVRKDTTPVPFPNIPLGVG